MVLALLIVIGLSLVGGIILGIANIVSRGKILGENLSSGYYSDEYDQQSSGFFGHDSNNSIQRDTRSYSNPFDNHWESSFDWKDKDNDGYDDRNDGFWNEREF